MRPIWAVLAVLALLVAGCSLAEDITPPPGLASAEALRPAIPATATAEAPRSPVPAAATPEATRVAIPETQAEPTPSALGTIRGRVVNGTAGGTVPARIEIALYVLDGEAETVVGTTTADPDGAFNFGGLEMVPGRLYFAAGEYQGVEFASVSAHFLADNTTPLDLPLTVYETTAERSTAEVTQMHLIVLVPSEGTLRVSEVWVLSNSGDRAILLAEGEALLNVALPQGAQLLDIQPSSSQDTFMETDQGFGFSTPLLPGNGTAQMAVTYDIPFGGRLTLTQPMDNLVQSVVILTELDGPTVRGPGIVEAEPVEMGAASLHQYVAGPFPAGERLEVTISTGARFPWDQVIGGAVLLAALLAVGLWWLRRRSRAGEEDAVPPESSSAGDSSEKREALLRGIAALDDDFEAGKLPEAEYRRRRDDLKRRVLALRA
jgi:hypothetical protein